jgi:glyoxylase-like metal-dependent hydrolase (beta-lactamase superfamily II)
MQRIELDGGEIVGLRADNPGPLTLTGTNSWIVGARPGWLIDPGPALPAHVQALADELDRRGGLGGIALTHDHADHSEAVVPLRRRFPQAPLAAVRGDADVRLRDGTRFGPLETLALPGHAVDHVVFLTGRVGFSGDAVLGRGSVFVAPGPGSLAGYLEGLRRLLARRPRLLCPGHGPPVEDPEAKLAEYLAHRQERERRLRAAIAAGGRSVDELLDAAWGDIDPNLRPVAAITLAAHLDKLAEEGRLPADVERPALGEVHPAV